MKKLLTVIFFFPGLLFAQQKSAGFIKKILYVKFSPALLAPTNATERMLLDVTVEPGMFCAIGAKITRYTAVGLSAGYFMLKEAGTITPVGVDLTITDFKAKRAFPVITGQWYHADFTEQYQRGGSLSHSYRITGKDMYHIGAGMAFRAFKSKQIQVTLGYARLNGKTIVVSSYGPYSQSTTSYYKDHQNMLVLSACFVL